MYYLYFGIPDEITGQVDTCSKQVSFNIIDMLE